MDERYWIINDCLYTLRKRAIPPRRWLGLEVKLLQLRVELLKSDGEVSDVEEVIPFGNLKLLVHEYVSDGQSREIYGQILECTDTLLTEMRRQAAENICVR